MKKIISIILCIALLLSTVAFAETGADISCACGDTHVSNCPNNTCLNCGATGGVHALDCPLRPFLADIGDYAEFNSAYNNFPIIGYHPSGIDSGDAFHSDNIVEFDPASVPAVKIADVALSSDGDSCWYKLEAVAGIPLPDNFPEEPWVFQDYITYPGGASLIVHKPAGGNNIYEQDPEAEPLMMSKSSGEGSAADCECPMINGLHYATCDYYICPNCGLGPWKHEIEDCPMLADIGKVAEINPDAYDLILVATADEPDENWEEDYMPFDPTDFSADILFFIDGYKIVTEYVSDETVAEMAEGEETNTVDELRSIWYEVHVVKGTAPEDFEDGYWIFQNYVGVNADPYDVLILREADQCPACGKYDCGEEHEDEPACGCCGACTGAEGCECGCDSCEFAPEDDEEFDEDGVITGTVTDAEGNPVLDGSGDPLVITVTGEGIPKGAEVEASELNAGFDTPVLNILDIKVKDGENRWQPSPGKTVSVGLPIADDIDTVHVFHFLEDPEIIRYMMENGLMEPIDVSFGVNDTEYSFVEPAVKAYQKATGTNDICFLMEAFMDVPVINGVATVDANGFSLFSSINPIELANMSSFRDLSTSKTYYVRPGEWLEVAGFNLLGGGLDITSGTNYVDIVDEEDGWLFSGNSIYFHVKNDAEVNATFKIRHRYIYGVGGHTVTFQVVEDFDYGNVYIGVVGHNNPYPNEISIHAQSAPNYYLTSANTLATTSTVNRLYPRTLIDVDALNTSNDLEFNDSNTVYGLERTNVSILSYLKNLDNVGGDGVTYDGLNDVTAAIKTAYFALPANAALDSDDYGVIPYVIKHETIGSNAGWYVNFKIVPLDKFTLSYDYNEPDGFNAMDDIGTTKKPSGYDIPTIDDNGNKLTSVTATVESGVGMEMKYTQDGEEYKATFKGWSTDPNAIPSSYTSGEDDNWYDAGEDITLTKDTTLYAIWETKRQYVDANVRFKKLVTTGDGNPIETNRDFSFSVDSKFIDLQYAIFDEAGQTVVSRRAFSAGALTFTLKANHYIIIYDVPNNDERYVITESVPDGYTAPNNGVAYGSINSDTNKSGAFNLEFTNVITTYDITYNLGNGVNHADNPATYTVEDTVVIGAPTREGYTFLGWTGSNVSTPQLTVTIPAGSTGNKNYTANWEKNKYTITWNANGGEFSDDSTTKTTTVEHGAVPAAPGTPSKADTAQYDYSFSGWEPEVVAATGDATYTARYNAETKTYTVTWKNYDGTVLETDENVPYGTTPTYDGEKPAKSNTQQYSYTFAGWSPTVSEVTGDAVYTATFTETVNKYTITWMVDGKKTTETYEYGATPNFKGSTDKASDARYSYSFAGWNPSISAVTGDTTYTATYNRTPIPYSITYNLNGGTVAVVNPTEYNVETPTFTLTNPTKTGYTFIGWTGSNGDTPQTTVTIAIGSTGNKSYTANWEAVTYTISYDLAGGSVSGTNPASYTIESSAITLINPTRIGYTFAGWTGTGLDSATASVTIAAGSTGNRSYTATWTPITYTITYDLAGGSVSGANPTSYTIESTDITLINPTKTGYVFKGWTGTGLTEATANVTIATGSIGDRTYTATWEVETYTITYKGLEGAVVSANPTTYTIETATFTLNNPTKAGYTFEGWTGTDLSGATARVTIEKGSTGDREYTATWKEAYADLTITASGADNDQTFIYVISGTPDDTATHGATITLTVAVLAGQKVVIKDLPVGKYTVTEQSDWNWRYENKSESEFNFTVAGKQIEFKYGAVTTDKWLNDYFRKRGKGAEA